MTFDGSGRLFEEEILGLCYVVWDGTYISYKAAMRQVREHQPSSPFSPACPTARTLHRQVALKLGVSEWSELEFYTAVKSPLDVFHGIDAFMVWKGTVVTIDVTINPNKTEAKADILYHREDGLIWLIDQVAEEFGGRGIYA